MNSHLITLLDVDDSIFPSTVTGSRLKVETVEDDEFPLFIPERIFENLLNIHWLTAWGPKAAKLIRTFPVLEDHRESRVSETVNGEWWRLEALRCFLHEHSEITAIVWIDDELSEHISEVTEVFTHDFPNISLKLISPTEGVGLTEEQLQEAVAFQKTFGE